MESLLCAYDRVARLANENFLDRLYRLGTCTLFWILPYVLSTELVTDAEVLILKMKKGTPVESECTTRVCVRHFDLVRRE